MSYTNYIGKLLCLFNISIFTIVFHPLLSFNSSSVAEAKYNAYAPTDVYDKNVKLSLLNPKNEDIDREFDDFIKNFDNSSTYNLLNEELENGNTTTTASTNDISSFLNLSNIWKYISVIFQIITSIFMFHLLFTNPLGQEMFSAVASFVASCVFSSLFMDLISYGIVFAFQYISFGIAWFFVFNSEPKYTRIYSIFSCCTLIGGVLYNIISPAPIFPSSTGPVGLFLLAVGLDPIKHIILLRLFYLVVLYLLSASIYLRLPSLVVSGPSESDEIEISDKQTTFLNSIVCCWTLSSTVGNLSNLFFYGINPISPDNTFLTPSLVGFNVTTIVCLSIWVFSSLIMWEGYGVWYGRKDGAVERTIPPGFITEKWRVYSSSS